MTTLPRMLITLGDVAGIGPEIVAKGWAALCRVCRPIVVGDLTAMRSAMSFAPSATKVAAIEDLSLAQPEPTSIPLLQATKRDLSSVRPGKLSAAAGGAAFDFLCTAIDLTLARQADGIVTLPLNKEGLHAAGIKYPGHTEILADKTGVRDFGMMLYAPALEPMCNPVGVVHVTLHMALTNVFANISADGVFEKIRLVDGVMRRLCGGKPRIGVCALNPHAGDGGIFGDEEARLIAPAVARGLAAGIDVAGPIACDAIFMQARAGRFDGIVAMYHDQGHIALKLLAGRSLVNITLGLPIVRTSVAHGTAYDIAGRGVADASSLIEAAEVAVSLFSGSPSASAGDMTRVS